MYLIGVLKQSYKLPKLTNELAEIVEDVQRETGCSFCLYDIADILTYVYRKCKINGKGEDYIPILFENELRDFLIRATINAISMQK